MQLVQLFWNSQSLMMKRIFSVLGFLTVFLVIHGTWTLRTNYQRAFAQAVERKIAIESIHVKAVRGTLVLTGLASKEQKIYAEYVAKTFLERYARRSINAPSGIRSEIQINTDRHAITKTLRNNSRSGRRIELRIERKIASVLPKLKSPRSARQKTQI